jgi:hypothetical protein
MHWETNQTKSTDALAMRNESHGRFLLGRLLFDHVNVFMLFIMDTAAIGYF